MIFQGISALIIFYDMKKKTPFVRFLALLIRVLLLEMVKQVFSVALFCCYRLFCISYILS